MYTVTHPPIAAKTGENVRIVFTITDRQGNAVDVSGAEATYRIARRAGEAALLEKTETNGVMLASNTAAVDFSTADLADADGPMTGDFLGQLAMTMDGDGLVVAEGTITISSSVRSLP
jgi:hypothetical protein